MNLGGFSWKRLLGLSAFKSHISRKIGIPLTRNGLYQKLGRMILRSSCLTIPVMILLILAAKLMKYIFIFAKFF